MYKLIDDMIIAARVLVMATLENLPGDDRSSTLRYMLWRTMYGYVETSLLLLIKTRIDEGYALLRMAAELTRDIARIAENQGNYDIWIDRLSVHNKEKYKKIFQFNKNDEYEKHLFRLYNLASDHGVHGHQTRDMHLRPLGLQGKYIKINVPKREMLDLLNVWLFAFFPLHIIVGRTFDEIYLKINPNPLTLFIEMESTVVPVLQDIRKNIRQNFPKTT